MPALSRTAEAVAELVERLALACIDVEPERCEPDALRSTAKDMIALAALLDATEPDPERVYVEVAYPQHARWIVEAESPAGDGWVFAREVSSGQVLSFAPGTLRPLR